MMFAIISEVSSFRRFPFDWKNPVGFLIAISIQYTMFKYGSRICTCFFALSIGSQLYAIALSKAIKGSLLSINQNNQAKSDEPILLEQINEFIELHSNAQQLSKNESVAFSSINFSSSQSIRLNKSSSE